MNPKTLAPSEIESILSTYMAFPHGKSYGQVSTVDQEDQPDTCTVHWHALMNWNVLGFCTHRQSTKFHNLGQNPFLSGCYWNREQGFQLRWKAVASLEAISQNPELKQNLWNLLRKEVRTAYWLCHMGLPLGMADLPSINHDQIPEEFSPVLCNVHEWDLFWDASSQKDSEYRFGKRTKYILDQSQQWEAKSVNHVHSAILEGPK
ncbi:MAG: pyridoxamine 5'-phosphate oxidase family protein [Bdellovibrionota bacterium]